MEIFFYDLTESSESSKKKFKDDESENQQTKTLMDMPDPVLEQVFDFLDLYSKKNFSLCCKKFDEIFGLLKNMDQLKFLIKSSHRSSDISEIKRRYKHVQVYHDVEVPPSVWTTLSENMASLRITVNQLSPETLILALPFLKNLTLLSITYNDLKEMPVTIETEAVEMNELKILHLTPMLYLLLNDRYVKFSDKLERLIFFPHSTKIVISSEEAVAIKSLISRQKQLKSLALYGYVSSFAWLFNEPLIIESQLEKFYLHNIDKLNSIQQDNFCEFLQSQKIVDPEIHFFVEDKTHRIQNLENPMRNLNSTDAQQCVMIADNFDGRVDSGQYTTEELLRQPKTPNLTTKNLHLYIKVRLETNVLILRFISSKFPNLKSLKITGLLLHTYDLKELSELKNLESLSIKQMQIGDLSTTIAVPNIKIFEFSTVVNSTDELNLTPLRMFLDRHRKIEFLSLSIEGRTNSSISEYTQICEIYEFAVQNLDRLKEIKRSLFCGFTSRILEENLVQSLVTMSGLIAVHAKPGLIIQFQKFKLMKRFDNKVLIVE